MRRGAPVGARMWAWMGVLSLLAGCSAVLDLDAEFDGDAAIPDGSPDGSVGDADGDEDAHVPWCIALLQDELHGRSGECHECVCGGCEARVEACDDDCHEALRCGLEAMEDGPCGLYGAHPTQVDCVADVCGGAFEVEDPSEPESWDDAHPSARLLRCLTFHCEPECVPDVHDLQCILPDWYDVANCQDGEETYWYVVDFMEIAGHDIDTGWTPGFNVDGCNTKSGGPTGCGYLDRRYDIDQDGVIEGREEGVDNQLAGLAGVIESEVDIQDRIDDGTLTILIRLSHVTDPENDPCVEVAFFAGLEGVEGAFQIDEASYDAQGDPRWRAQGVIENGRLLAGPMRWELSVPVEDVTLTFDVSDTAVAFDVGTEALAMGLVGGALGVEQLAEELEKAFGVDVEELLAMNADLRPDANNDNCEAMSGAFTFTAEAAAVDE